MSFEARYHRFGSIKSMSLLSEKLYGPLQVKHAVYLMFSIMFAWRGLSTGNQSALAFALVVAFIGLLSAVVGVKSMSFEAKLFMVLYSMLDAILSSPGRRPAPARHQRPAAATTVRRVLEVAKRVLLYPRVELRLGGIKIVIPTLAISVPGAVAASCIAIASEALDARAKAGVVAASVLLVVVPHVLGLRWEWFRERVRALRRRLKRGAASLRALAYVIALVILLAVVLSMLGGEPHHVPAVHVVPQSVYANTTVRCPYANTTNTRTYVARLTAPIPTPFALQRLLYVDASAFDPDEYMRAAASMAVLLAVNLTELNVRVELSNTYFANPLPISEKDKEGVANRSMYICFLPPHAFPVLSAVNMSQFYVMDEYAVKVFRTSPRNFTAVRVYSSAVAMPPYASVNVSYSSRPAENVTVVGVARPINYTYSKVWEVVGRSKCRRDPYLNSTVCETHVYEVYEVRFWYEVGYTDGASRVVSVEQWVGEVIAGEYQDPVTVVVTGGYYRGAVGPLAGVAMTISFDYDVEHEYDNSTDTHYYRYTHRIKSIDFATMWRGAVVDTIVNVAISVVGSEQVTGFTPARVLIPEHATLEFMGNARVPVRFADRFDICAKYMAPNGTVYRCLSDLYPANYTRVFRAGEILFTYEVLGSPWAEEEWYTAKPLPYAVRMEVRLADPPRPPIARVVDVGETVAVHVSYDFIASAIDDFINTAVLEALESAWPPITALNMLGKYADFFKWVLSTQLVIWMRDCDESNPYTALAVGCGSDEAKALILANVLYRLGIDNAIWSVSVRTINGTRAVWVPGLAVTARGFPYPQFYDLWKARCIGVFDPSLTGYLFMVAYDTVQESVFSIIDRISFHRVICRTKDPWGTTIWYSKSCPG